MSFTTLTFFLLFAFTFAAYWTCTSRRLQNAILVAASFVFYSWWDYRFCGLMLGASLIDYCSARLLEKTEGEIARRSVLLISLCSNLGMLGYFKYAKFFVESFVSSAAALGFTLAQPSLDILLPVGISFYTFQTMSYAIDVYRRKLRAEANLVDYMAFVTFFPQLVAGPIQRAGDLLPQFQRDRYFDFAQAQDGVRQAFWGLWKKLVVADNLGLVVAGAYRNVAAASGPTLLLATLAFAFQIYADFSAYSDIAIGTARCFGINLSRNFAFPYFALSPAEFWRRWHISLSTWFRDYVYVSLGGNRGSRLTSARNLLLTFGLSGLWHGASWNFLIWGLLNGLAGLPSQWSLAPRRGVHTTAGGTDNWLPDWRSLGAMLATFAFICSTWVFFRAASLGDAILVFVRILSDVARPAAYAELPGILKGVGQSGVTGILAALALIVAEWCTRDRVHPLQGLAWRIERRWLTYGLLLWSAIVFEGPLGQFIYFQF